MLRCNWRPRAPRCPGAWPRAGPRYRRARWGVAEGEIEQMAEGVIDLFIAGIAKP